MRLPKIDIKLMDILTLLTVSALTVVFSLRVYGGAREGGILVTAEAGEWRFSSGARETLFVEGPLGVTEVRIENGRAAIVRSPCPNKLCVQQGKTSGVFNTVSCIPNRVLVRAGGGAENMDALSW